jgi:uncharacterized membrane protein
MGDQSVPEYAVGIAVHIAAGALGLVSGAVAMAASKGEPLHRRAGTVFAAAMAVMAGTATVLAAGFGHWESLLPGALTLYLVLTAWHAARGDGSATAHDAAFAAGALGLAIGGLMLAGAAAKSAQGTLNGYPPEMYAIFAGLSLWAALWDLTALTQGRLSRRARLARHLWRMGLALTIAAAAFFLGQPDYFPETLRGSPLLAVPPLAALGATLVWFARVWLTNTFKERDGR